LADSSLKLPSISLFWRTFGLLLVLLFTGFALWSQGIAIRQEHPRATALAGQLVTAVNLTRSALVHSKPSDRATLLLELNQDERVGVFVREESDAVIALPESRINGWLQSLLKDSLGKDTQIASEVNLQKGLWISFDMGGNTLGLNTYWLRVEPARMETRAQNPTRWWLWLASALLVALLGAAWMTRRLTQPLSQLAARTQALSAGHTYAPLPSSNVKEIAQVNAGMNHMAQSLANQEAERTLMLAGLSHDLRTPLARLRLEIEMANLEPSQKTAMVSDISQIDAQLKQFTDYIASSQAQLQPLDLQALLAARVARFVKDPRGQTVLAPCPPTPIVGDAQRLTRLIDNLLENALRYGANNQGIAHIEASVETHKNNVTLSIKDHGRGVNKAVLSTLTQPFVRGDTARSGADGSGLGLAIVAKIAQQHGAVLTLHSEVRNGFQVRVAFNRVDTTNQSLLA
jgi:two-component system, OmpR family, osmolarity sensor histidine kinase EnvZ